MKYPFFSNWIAYKRIPGQDAYYVKDFVLDTKSIISSEMMAFAKKLDGKTDPYSIRGKRSLSETRKLIEELDHMGVIRKDHGVLSDGDGFYMRTLMRTRNTKSKRALSKILNAILVVAFVPILVSGILVFLHADEFGYCELSMLGKIVYDHPVICVWIFNIFSLICGGAIHEVCHGIACRAYGGRVFEYGAMINILPGFYTLMDESKLQSRLKKIQILAAGVEGNLFFAGCLLLLTGVLPELKFIFSVGALINIIMTFINMLAIDGTDGMKILLLLIGMESKDIDDIKCMTKGKNKREILAKDGYYGVTKLTACHMIIWLQRIYPIVVLLDVIAVIGAFL